MHGKLTFSDHPKTVVALILIFPLERVGKLKIEHTAPALHARLECQKVFGNGFEHVNMIIEVVGGLAAKARMIWQALGGLVGRKGGVGCIGGED